jgi:phage baseplate assembly protein V
MSVVDRIWRRVLLMIGRGRITFVADGGAVQRVQVQLGLEEIKDASPRLAEYGFQSNPPDGSDAIVLFLAGERSNGVIVATGSQTYRMKGLATGEVAISDDKGQSVYLSAAGIRVEGNGLPINVHTSAAVTVDAPTVHMTGALNVDGAIHSGADITATGNVADQNGAKTMAGMRSVYNGHHHGASAGPDASM